MPPGRPASSVRVPWRRSCFPLVGRTPDVCGRWSSRGLGLRLAVGRVTFSFTIGAVNRLLEKPQPSLGGGAPWCFPLAGRVPFLTSSFHLKLACTRSVRGACACLCVCAVRSGQTPRSVA